MSRAMNANTGGTTKAARVMQDDEPATEYVLLSQVMQELLPARAANELSHVYDKKLSDVQKMRLPQKQTIHLSTHTFAFFKFTQS